MIFSIKKLTFFCATLSVVSACSSQPQDINDPYETVNREAHEVNKALDRAIIKPVAQGYAAVMPDPLETAVTNVATNLSYPGDLVNYLIQGDLGNAMVTGNAFFLNTVFGIGGLFDVATALDAAPRSTDFGETMAKWGAGEGRYVELLGLGPSTERDAVGKIVDFALDPLGPLLSADQANIARATRVGKVLDTRNDYATAIDGLLYGSADSYAQARLFYLQNRRYTLGIEQRQSADPFEELYGTE